jgi:hypothetical protein
MSEKSKQARILIVGAFISSAILGVWGMVVYPRALTEAARIPSSYAVATFIFLAVFFMLSALLFSYLAYTVGALAGGSVYGRWRDYARRLLPFMAAVIIAYTVISVAAGLLAAVIGPAIENAYGYYYARALVTFIATVISVPVAPVVISLYVGYTGSRAPLREATMNALKQLKLKRTYPRLLLLSAAMYVAGYFIYTACDQIANEALRAGVMIAIYSALGSASVYAIYRICGSQMGSSQKSEDAAAHREADLESERKASA